MKTILYYTSNREDPEFEEKIRSNILNNAGGLPIVSVSQKPIDFGKNICVGDIGHSYESEWKQILAGARKAKTKYLVFAEADFLYPEEYFSFKPDGKNLYRYNNVWILWKKGSNAYRRKKYSEGAQIVQRKYLIKKYEEYFNGQGNYPLEGEIYEWFGKNPCVSFKTGDGVRSNTGTLRGRGNHLRSIPYWGDAVKLMKKYL